MSHLISEIGPTIIPVSEVPISAVQISPLNLVPIGPLRLPLHWPALSPSEIVPMGRESSASRLQKHFGLVGNASASESLKVIPGRILQRLAL